MNNFGEATSKFDICKCGGQIDVNGCYALTVVECKTCGSYLVSQDGDEIIIKLWNEGYRTPCVLKNKPSL